MWNYLKEKLKSQPEKTICGFRRNREQSNLAEMLTYDNRTPLVFALCHPEITKEIIQDFWAYTKIPLGEAYSTQLFVAIGEVARQKKMKNYHYLKPILHDIDAGTLNQLFHFPCRYNNAKLLRLLIEQSIELQRHSSIKFQRQPSIKFQQPPSKNISLNEKDHAGYTPLMTAVFYSSTECVEHLMEVSKIFIYLYNH
jgi:hypothetical protein